jgi:mannose-6-phosphate isomerase-like protein (cupin superfamily)
MKMNGTVQPRHFQQGEGKSYKLGRMTMTFKTTAEQDWNAYTVCEAIEPPESGAGYHRHATYDETFIICEGRYDFRLDGKLLKLSPGTWCLCPGERRTASSAQVLRSVVKSSSVRQAASSTP